MFNELPAFDTGTICSISGGGCPQIENAIGIIKAIQAHTFGTFDKMIGTSAGAIVASMHMSLDQDITKLEQVIRSSQPSDWFAIKKWQLVKSIFGLSNYVADNTKLKQFLHENINGKTAENVEVAVTEMGDYLTRNYDCARSFLVDGRASHVLASMSFQSIFPPVVCNGKMYGDGGVNNLCPLPSFQGIAECKHLYIILGANSPLFPRLKFWKFMDRMLSLIDKTMEREVAQIHELGLHILPQVTVFQPEKWVESASFLNWSKNFEQIGASYKYALEVLENEENK